MTGDVVAFLGVSLLLIMTPGQDTALAIRNTVPGDRQGYAVATVKAAGFLQRSKICRVLDGVMGAVFMALGPRLAPAQR